MTFDDLNNAIKTIREECNKHHACIECPMNQNCNENPTEWREVKGNED